MSKSRVPAGVSTGGQFAPERKAEAVGVGIVDGSRHSARAGMELREHLPESYQIIINPGEVQVVTASGYDLHGSVSADGTWTMKDPVTNFELMDKDVTALADRISATVELNQELADSGHGDLYIRDTSVDAVTERARQEWGVDHAIWVTMDVGGEAEEDFDTVIVAYHPGSGKALNAVDGESGSEVPIPETAQQMGPYIQHTAHLVAEQSDLSEDARTMLRGAPQ